MQKMTELLENFPVIDNGLFPTNLEGVRVFQQTCHVPRQPMVYKPGICIVVQGHKIGFLGERKFRYDANHYLVTTVTIPFECETFGSPAEPLRGLFIDIDMPLLHELIGTLGLRPEFSDSAKKGLPSGIGPAQMEPEMLDAITRLLKCLKSPQEAGILGPGLVREILYRVLCGTQAPVLYSLAMHSGTFSQMAGILKIMQSDYAGKLDVESLATKARMSTSAFHRAFKDITSDSPIQYLKKIRLTKARDLMMQENMKAYLAADTVGYESTSQFSREFKRYFGQSPAEMMRERTA